MPHCRNGLDYNVARGPQSRIQQCRARRPRQRAQENRRLGRSFEDAARAAPAAEKQIQSLMAAYEDMAKLYYGANADKPDPKVEAQAAALAKKNGFASLAQYDDALTNIIIIMSGIDPQTKNFTEPPEQIKNEIAALKADKSVPETDKKQGLAQLEAALKIAKAVQFKENIALVLKYYDQLAPFMQEL